MGDEQGPLVSIVTPSLNQGKFIEETILTVKNQRYPNFEHIIVDGGSTDNTLDILRKYEGTYNLCWISEPDEGQADAVNKGFSLARGDIIGWLNSDDIYCDLDTIGNVIQAFSEQPEVDVIYGDVIIIGEDGLALAVQCVPTFKYSRLLRECFLKQPAVFLKREVIKGYALDTSLYHAMDYEYWLRIGREKRFRRVPILLSADRNHLARKMNADKEGSVNESEEVRRRYGAVPGLKSTLARYIDRLLSGVPRRMKGLLRLMALYGRQDLPFYVQWDSRLMAIRRQVLWTDMRSLINFGGER